MAGGASAGRLRSYVRKRSEARIQELTRAKVERVRESIEKSIVGLEEARKDTEGRRAFVDRSIKELETRVSKETSPFSQYRDQIRPVLKKTEVEQRVALANLVGALLLQEGAIEAALSGLNQRALHSRVFVFAPPDQLIVNTRKAVPARLLLVEPGEQRPSRTGCRVLRDRRRP